MKLWKISQSAVTGYDTYSDAVVAAPNEKVAKTIHPQTYPGLIIIPVPDDEYISQTWTNDPAKVTAEFLGNAKKGTLVGVICHSFHAG